MKKVFTAGLVMASSLAFAQSAKVVSAYNYNKKGELDKAWQFIEEATKDPGTGVDPKTWKYRFDILNNIKKNLMSPQGVLEYKSILKPEDLIAEMKQSYLKTKEYDTKKKFIEDIEASVKLDAAISNNMAVGFYNVATELDTFSIETLKAYGLVLEENKTKADGITKNIDALKSRAENRRGAKEIIKKCLDGDKAEVANCIDGAMKLNYMQALQMFGLSAAANEMIGQVDSLSMFNAAFCAQKAGMKKEAAQLYEDLTAINYGGAYVYSTAAQLYKDLGEKDKSVNIINKGRKAYPEDLQLLMDELNLYLAAENYVEAEKLLKVAIEKMPTNEYLFLAMGTAYDQLANPIDKATGKDLPKPANYAELVGKAKDSYKRAIELKPDFYDALFNYAALTFNDGAEFYNKANKLDPRSQKAKFDELIKKSDEKFKEALVLFERAHELNKEDKAVLQSLKNLYIRLELTEGEKYKAVVAKLKQ